MFSVLKPTTKGLEIPDSGNGSFTGGWGGVGGLSGAGVGLGSA